MSTSQVMSNRIIIKALCVFMASAILMGTACVSSERSLRQFNERMVSEKKVKTEDTLGEPKIEVAQRPISSSPDFKFTVFADTVKRDSFIQRYEKTEKFEQTHVRGRWLRRGRRHNSRSRIF